MAPIEIHLRPAAATDCARTFEWSNDPEVRASSFHEGPIAEDEHRTWYASALSGVRTLYIAEAQAAPIGVARLDPLPPDAAEVGLTVAAEYRGKGFALPTLEALCRIASETGLRRLVARIRTDNPRSRKIFERAGFRCELEETVNGISALRLVRDLD